MVVCTENTLCASEARFTCAHREVDYVYKQDRFGNDARMCVHIVMLCVHYACTQLFYVTSVVII
jgi:hypothetical protein